ncbi:TPA: DUF7446 family protein, partial [Salmonella enterica subsp. enterica serovar Muenchen]|nr:hypothetical protein [Salmonella enterica]
MSLIKTMGASPLTGTIYYGTLNTEKGIWVGKKTDVTEMACRAVAEYLMHEKISRVYGLHDGKELMLSVAFRHTAEPEAQQLTAAARDVLAERNRQQSVEGWTQEHDDAYNGGELARAAACYARHASARGGIYAENPAAYKAEGVPDDWPWAEEWWKPASPYRDLEKAGALILAEMERINRANCADCVNRTAGTSEGA